MCTSKQKFPGTDDKNLQDNLWAFNNRLKRIGVLTFINDSKYSLFNKTGELPIHKAVRCRDCEKQSEILRHLCEHGSDINHVNKIDCSPLYLATFYGCLNKVHTLLLYGADINR